MAALLLVLGAVPHMAFAQTAGTSYYRYGLGQRLTGTIAPDPDGAGPLHFPAVRNTYDAGGRLTTVEKGELSVWQSEAVDPANWGAAFTVYQTVVTTYDDVDRKLTEMVKGSNGLAVSLTQYSYDAVGRLECTATRMNPATYGALPASACTLGPQGSQGPDRITRNVYDAAGQLLQVRKAVGTPLEQAYATYAYSPNGKQTDMVDANGNHAQMVYDGFDRQTQWIFPSTARPAGFDPSTPASALATAGAPNAADYEQYSYDANGNRTFLQKRDGSLIEYQYDALNRMTAKVVPSRANLPATHRRSVYYAYDLRGLMTSAQFSGGVAEGITTEYDGFGRISSSTLAMDGASRTLSYLYDANGNRTRVTYPDGGFVQYGYDGLDRAASVTGNAGDWTRTFGYDAAGSLIGDYGGSAGSTTYGRDPIGRMQSHNRDLFGTYGDVSISFTYNPASQIVSEAKTNDNYAFTRLYNVDRTYTTNGLNQYTAAGSAAFCYDKNGNLTADGSTAYLYDIENRLVEAHDQGTGNADCNNLSYAGALKASLRYDPMGRLYEINGATTGTTRFLNDGDAMVAEYASNGAMLRRFVHGPDAKADDPLAWYEGAAMSNAAVRFLYADHQGSITANADINGYATRLFKYDEYGIPQSSDGAALLPGGGGRFLYTGQIWVPELGMYYYKARMYSASMGRFMQTDPIGYADQVNLYGYAWNDPVNMWDFDGQCAPWCVGFVVGVAVEAGVQAIENGHVDLSAKGIGRLAVAGAAGALGGGIGAGVAKISASIAVRAATNGVAGAAIGAAQTAANAKINGQQVTGAQLAKGAALGAVGGSAGSAVSDGVRGGARVLAEKTGMNIVTKAGQVATPAASSTRDQAIRSIGTTLGNAAGNAPSVADAAKNKVCSSSNYVGCQ